MDAPRSRRILKMALEEREAGAGTTTGRTYSVVKVVELNKFIVTPTDELKKSHIQDLYVVKCDGKNCRCILVKSGEKSEMESLMIVMQRFVNTEKKFKNLGMICSSTQTGIELLHALVEPSKSGTDAIECDSEKMDIGSCTSEGHPQTVFDTGDGCPSTMPLTIPDLKLQTAGTDAIECDSEKMDVGSCTSEGHPQTVFDTGDGSPSTMPLTIPDFKLQTAGTVEAERDTERVDVGPWTTEGDPPTRFDTDYRSPSTEPPLIPDSELQTIGGDFITMSADFLFAEYTISNAGELVEVSEESTNQVNVGEDTERTAELAREIGPTSVLETIEGSTSITPSFSEYEQQTIGVEQHTIKQSLTKPDSTFDTSIDSSSISETLTSTETSPQEKLIKDIPTKKHHFCTYCKTVKTNISRHFMLIHKEENEVKKFMSMEVNTRERKRLEGQLRRKGDAEYHIILKQQGKPAVTIRKGVSEMNTLPCPNCKLLYSKMTLNRHYRVCAKKNAPKNLLHIARSLAKPGNLAGEHFCTEFKEHVLRGMPEDNINNRILTDNTILDYGNSLTLKHAADIPNKKNFIRARMRSVSKLSILASEIDNSISKIDELFHPSKWNTFIEAIRLLGNMSGEVAQSTPYNTIHAGLNVVNIAKDFKAVLPLDEEGKKRREEVQAWVDLYSRKFQATIGKHALKVAAEKKWKASSKLPIAKDIMKLTNYLKLEIEQNTAKINNKQFTIETYDRLCKATMLHLLTFNRRRIGEVNLLKVEDFKRKEKINEESDAFRSLNEEEKAAARKFFHVNVKGKWHRAVPLLLTDTHSAAIDTIINFRELAGVGDSNPYLFGKGSSGHYDASESLREAALECKAENPRQLTGTQLRKHAATASQSLELSENDLRLLSSFLGHTVKTHLEHYRQPSDVLHTARLSKVLVALDSGEISKLKGKKLEDIHLAQDTDTPQPSTSTQAPLSMKYKKTSSKKSTTSTRKSISLTPTKHSPSKHSPSKHSPEKTSPCKRRRIRWTEVEKKIMRNNFAQNLKQGTLPSFQECYEVRCAHDELKGRQVQKMKAWVNNEIVRIKKITQYESDEESN